MKKFTISLDPFGNNTEIITLIAEDKEDIKKQLSEKYSNWTAQIINVENI